jgi:hypothetical protein
LRINDVSSAGAHYPLTAFDFAPNAVAKAKALARRRDVNTCTRVSRVEETFSDWEILVIRHYDEMIQEGRGHNGMSALIDLVARKS